ncbi:MAG: topoisomerase [Candidatus Berkelbacteria bacterium]|nr:topoisomerase [Candidatus Berkelbacteria bacterium]
MNKRFVECNTLEIMNLVIVESPAKGRTIKNILGPNFNVLASFGHIRDLPKKELGIDIKNEFEPKYEIPAKARKTIKMIKDEIAQSDNLYLATDYDREGEAIAWHIIQAIGSKNLKSKTLDKKYKRITFHEITKPAILEAIKNPRDINMDLVDAQQGRRILDRLVGYKLSPFLWQKVAQGLSAGRVQSVATRLIVEREREIRQFKPEEYWQVDVTLTKKDDKKEFKAQLTEKDNEKISKLSIRDEKEAQGIVEGLENAQYQVNEVKIEIKNRYPSPPFTTSTLQQESARKFGFSAKRTMQIAQGLYEDGLITYMRTDSVQVSQIALSQANKVISDKFGSEYALDQPRFYKTKTLRAQEAHEAIRPTELSRDQIIGESERQKLYDLILKKMLASQMKEAQIQETQAKIKAKNYRFTSIGNRIKFDGFLKVYGAQEEKNGQVLPDLKPEEMLDFKKLEKMQKFTEPPARYTEGTLIKELEKKGIGRPSTYAPTLATIIDRGYVEKIQGKLLPKEIGEIVTDLLIEHFPEIIDYNFTAKIEDDLDKVAAGERKWQEVIKNFYGPFAKNLREKTKEVSKKAITEEKTDKLCPKCNKNLVIKLGRFGKFLACSSFPDCKYTAPLMENHTTPSSQEKCLKCGKNLVFKEGKFGAFLACEGYPKCKFTKNIEVAAKIACSDCGGKILQKRTRKGKPFWGCENYPSCKKAFWDEPQEKKCPKCNNILVANTREKILKCSQCDFKENI